jgi:amino acid transporter
MSEMAPRVGSSGEAEAQKLGYKPELRREFGFFHAFALSFADTSLIVAFYGAFALALGAAGPTFFWGMVIVFVFQTLVALVLGEVSSRYPLEGAIYQWTLEQTGATSGWFSAWVYWWTMIFTMTSCAYAAASFILPGLGFDSATKGWFIFAAAVIVLFGLAIGSIAQVVLKIFLTILLVAELSTTVVLALVFFFAYRTNPFSVLFKSFSQSQGGFNWLWLGFFGAIAFLGWTFLAFEAAGSIAEEVHEPEKNVPRAIIGVMLSIGIISLFVTVAFILAIPDMNAAMTGNIADPVIQTIAFHLGSGFERPILILISFGFMGSMVALHTAGSRTLYSFARDKMIPGSRFFVILSKNRKLPWVALYFTAAVSIVILLVNLGAEKVFLVLMQVSSAGFFISYAFVVISQLILHMKGRFTHGPFSLGRWSYPITAIASVWVVFEVFNLMWPRSPELPWYQNWAVVTISVGLAIVGIIVFLIVPRHDGHVGSPPKKEIAEGAAYADQPADGVSFGSETD